MRFRRRLAMRTFRAPVLAMLGMALSAPAVRTQASCRSPAA